MEKDAQISLEELQISPQKVDTSYQISDATRSLLPLSPRPTVKATAPILFYNQPIPSDLDLNTIHQTEYQPLDQQVTSALAYLNATKSLSQETIREELLIHPNDRKEKAAKRQFRPWFMWILSAIHVIALILSLILNWKVTGAVIQTNPFNPMIGPSVGVLISMGSKYVPCMRSTLLDTPGLLFQCPAGTKSTANATCTLLDVCGLGGFPSGKPDQSFRFLSALLLHGGVLHILFNLLFQLMVGAQLEREMGWYRIAPIFIIAGTGGFIFGANFGDVRAPSVGSSGGLFGLVACLLLELIQNWSIIKRPAWEFTKMLLNILVAFLIGMLPGIDNFSHIGGFMFGFLAGLVFMPKIYFSRQDRIRKITVQVLAVPLLIFAYAYLIKGFYDGSAYCPFCQYFNCLPGLPWYFFLDILTQQVFTKISIGVPIIIFSTLIMSVVLRFAYFLPIILKECFVFE